MSDKVFMYGDQETVDLLNRDVSKVILFGGYLGYNNFGDILQLKEAIKFHTTITMLEPVIICNLVSITDKDFLSRLRSWFGVRAFILVHYQPVDVAFLKLHLIDNVLSIDNLHVYGGGFLNRYWGNHILKQIEWLLKNFRVENYIVSGQQFDAGFVNRLKAHFEKYRPQLIGARDIESQRLLNSVGVSCEFSFDDASGIIETWARRRPELSGTREALFIHLNTSKYTWDKSEEHREELRRIAQILQNVAERFSSFEPVFLSAYSEFRSSAKDTLATIISLEDALPFLDYRVTDIAHMALLHDPNDIAIDRNLAVFSGGVGISSSYHAALFCNMLNVPCYLVSDNPYYKQKREGLGEYRTLDQFLENSSVLSYSRFMEQRGVWLNKLTSLFEKVERNPVRTKISFDYDELNHAPVPFQFKEVCVEEKENYRLRDELAKSVSALKEKVWLIEQLKKDLLLTKSEIAAETAGPGVRAASLIKELLGIKRK